MRRNSQLQSYEDLINNYLERLRDLEESQIKDNLEIEISMRRVDSLSKRIEDSLRQQREVIDEMKKTNDIHLVVSAAYAG